MVKQQNLKQKFYFRRKELGNQMIQMKMESANQRKESMEQEKMVKKTENIIDYFKKHWSFREQTLRKNIELLKLSEKMRVKGMQKRQRRFDRFRDLDESRRITLRREMAIKRSNDMLVEMIVKKFEPFSKKYLKSVDPLNLEEVSRRFALLSPQLVASCLEKISQVYLNLKMTLSSVDLVRYTLALMQQKVIILPDIGPTKCVSGI